MRQFYYSPIRETVEGEPPEIFPFLGTSRLEEPLGRQPLTAVFPATPTPAAPRAD